MKKQFSSLQQFQKSETLPAFCSVVSKRYVVFQQGALLKAVDDFQNIL